MADPSGASGGDESGASSVNSVDMERLVRQFHADVYRYAYRLTGRQADAEDVTQQAFLVAQQRLHQVRHPERIQGWLYTIARTCFLKSVRKRQPVSAASIELNVEEIPDSAEQTEIDSIASAGRDRRIAGRL